jgi:hypothetical protein
VTISQIVIPDDESWRVELLRKRERELGYLDTRYTSRRAELVILYGRRRVGKTQIFIVLTGSLLGVMRQQALAPDAPLYLRHTWPFELKPLTVADLRAFFPTYASDESVETYAVMRASTCGYR